MIPYAEIQASRVINVENIGRLSLNTSLLHGAESFLRSHWILPYSTVQSPSCEANWFAASQEIPRISRNPKVHYRTHNRPLHPK